MATAIEIVRAHDVVHDGDTVHDLIVSTTIETEEGIAAEYEHVERVCGERGTDWLIERQRLIKRAGERKYDILRVRMRNDAIHIFVFDITSFYGTHNNQHEVNNGTERS